MKQSNAHEAKLVTKEKIATGKIKKMVEENMLLYACV